METIKFVFDGKLAAGGQMSFYESARFQYSASRLLVKLDNFRRTGDFPKRITTENINKIILNPFRRGSFGLEVIAPIAIEVARLSFEVPISVLFSYVVERVFKTAGDDTIRDALATQRRLLDTFDNTIEGRDNTISRTIDLLRDEMEHGRDLNHANQELLERLAAETERRAYLQGQRDVLRRFTPDQEADLVTMAAPLLKEMNVPLRESASRAFVSREEEGVSTDLLFINKSMADEVDVAVVDRHLTTIDVDIVQYNKENGWGKFRNIEWEGLPSFHVPAEINDELKNDMVAAMRQQLVQVDCYFVRSVAGVPLRIIIIDVRRIEED